MMNEAELNRLIVEKLNDGNSLSDIQKQLKDEYDFQISYLDLRVKAAELEDVDWSRQESKVKPAAEDEAKLEESTAAAPGGVQVEVSKIARPGAAMHGSVVFTSGSKSEWILGNDGRLSLQPEPGAEKPSEEDILQFQEELQNIVYGGAR